MPVEVPDVAPDATPPDEDGTNPVLPPIGVVTPDAPPASVPDPNALLGASLPAVPVAPADAIPISVGGKDDGFDEHEIAARQAHDAAAIIRSARSDQGRRTGEFVKG